MCSVATIYKLKTAMHSCKNLCTMPKKFMQHAKSTYTTIEKRNKKKMVLAEQSTCVLKQHKISSEK